MKKRIIVFISVVFCFFAFLVNVKALNKIYFDSDSLSIMPGETKEIGVFVDSDKSFTTLKMNVITTSNDINFADIIYNEHFTKTINGNSVVLTSKTALKSGTKIATINIKASDNIKFEETGYIKLNNLFLNNVQLDNVSLKVEVLNEKVSNTYLKSITSDIIKIDFSKDTYDYEYEVSNDVKKLDLVAIAEDENSKINISDQNLKVGKNIIKITVTSSDNDKKVYTLVINRKENTEEKDEVSDNNNDDVIVISDKLETKKPDKTGFTLLLVALVCILIVDLIVMKKNKNKR